MSANAVAAPGAPKAGIGEQIAAMFNMLIDPASAVKVVPAKFSWVLPLLVFSVAAGIVQFLNVDTIMRIMQYDPPGNMTAEQFEKALPMIAMTQKVTAFVMPIMFGVIIALSAALVLAAAAMTGVQIRFRDVFSILCYASIVHTLYVIASYVVVRLKGDSLQSLAELRPGFGLDIFMPEGSNKLLVGVLNYFSVFTIWYIIVLTIAFAAYTSISKGKAFAVTSPAWILGLFFALLGAAFQS
jgi:hypothetical protein